jgi:DNA repair protein RadC
MSSARIAKNVSILLDKNNKPVYDDLLNISGLGNAKASQIIAALELGGRFQRSGLKAVSLEHDFYTTKTASQSTLEYITLNGAGETIKQRSMSISNTVVATKAVKKMYADAFHDNAVSLLIGIGSRTQSFEALDDQLLRTLKLIYDTANLLEFKLNSVWLVNQTSRRQFFKKTLQ